MQVSLSYILERVGSHDFDLEEDDYQNSNSQFQRSKEKIQNTPKNNQNTPKNNIVVDTQDVQKVKTLQKVNTKFTTFSWFSYLNSIDETYVIYLGSWNDKESLTILNEIFTKILNNSCYLKPMRHMICKHPEISEDKLKKWDNLTVKKYGYPYFKFSIDWSYSCDIKKNYTLDPNEAVHLFDKFLLSSQLLKTKSRKELIKHCEQCYPQLYNHCKSTFTFKNAITKMILEQELSSMEKHNSFFESKIN